LNLGPAVIPEGEVELGVRPEDFQTAGAGSHLPARVELISYAGSEKIAHARLGDERVTFSVPKDSRLAPGGYIQLGIAREKIHLFRKGRRVEVGNYDLPPTGRDA
jgi:ABC-type sugar transport system ATPase subunit